MDRLEYLRQVAQEAHDAAQAIDAAAKSGDEVRSLTAEESEDFTYLVNVRNACIAEGIELEARNEALAVVLPEATREAGEDRGAPAFHREVDPYDAGVQRDIGTVEAAKRAIDGMAKRGVGGNGQTRAESLLRQHSKRSMRGIDQHLLVYGDPAYADAFTKVVTGRESLLSAEERAALARADEFERAASIGTTTAGGFMIPTILDPSVILAVDGSSNPFRQISTVKSIMTNTWTGVSSAGISMSWDTEGSEVSDDTFTLSQPTITAYKLAGFVPFSIEAEDDISGLNTEIAREFAQAKDDAEAEVFAVGTGSNQPIGIVTALVGSSWTNFATNSALTVADLEKVRRHTGPRYRGAKASWVMNMAYNDGIRNLGTSGSLYSETVDLPELAVSKVLGSVVYESSAMTDAFCTTTTNNAVVYGDFSNYYIVDRIGTRLEYIPHLFATGNNRPSGQRGWYTYHRVGADSVNDQAFTLGVSPNTAFT